MLDYDEGDDDAHARAMEALTAQACEYLAELEILRRELAHKLTLDQEEELLRIVRDLVLAHHGGFGHVSNVRDHLKRLERFTVRNREVFYP